MEVPAQLKLPTSWSFSADHLDAKLEGIGARLLLDADLSYGMALEQSVIDLNQELELIQDQHSTADCRKWQANAVEIDDEDYTRSTSNSKDTSTMKRHDLTTDPKLNHVRYSQQHMTSNQIGSLRDASTLHQAENWNEMEPELLLQPETRPISHEQLVTEVKGIYAGLVMVEAKCIDVDEKQTAATQERHAKKTKLTPEQWSALIALHKTLLHEHHDFFLASQHPSASPALSKLAAKYSMPARMWRHGIHAFLEVLRHRLPHSLDHMLAFIYIAYSMMALLFETVPSFEDTWIECLGDLGHYRMAIEDNDCRDREVWSGVAKFWYGKAADKSPKVGRLYHHLAILARPYTIQQLSLYARSLTCAVPFESVKGSIMTLFNPILEPSKCYKTSMEAAFVKAYGLLIMNRATDWREGHATSSLGPVLYGDPLFGHVCYTNRDLHSIAKKNDIEGPGYQNSLASTAWDPPPDCILFSSLSSEDDRQITAKQGYAEDPSERSPSSNDNLTLPSERPTVQWHQRKPIAYFRQSLCRLRDLVRSRAFGLGLALYIPVVNASYTQTDNGPISVSPLAEKEVTLWDEWWIILLGIFFSLAMWGCTLRGGRATASGVVMGVSVFLDGDLRHEPWCPQPVRWAIRCITLSSMAMFASEQAKNGYLNQRYTVPVIGTALLLDCGILRANSNRASLEDLIGLFLPCLAISLVSWIYAAPLWHGIVRHTTRWRIRSPFEDRLLPQ